MNCPVCHKTTQPRHIGTADYCSVCGTRYPDPHAKPARAMDLARSRTAKPAAAVHHSRARGVIDLRDAPAHHTAHQPTHHPAKTPHVEHTQHHTPVAAPSAAAPSSDAQARHDAAFRSRLKTAREVDRSPLIQHFSDGLRAARPAGQTAHTSHHPAAHTPAPASAHTTTHASAHASTPAAITPGPELPNQAITHHESLARLAATAAEPNLKAAHSAQHHKAHWRPHLGLSPHKGRTLTTTAAVLIMGGYVWLQNYPKLALQSANSQAGVTATLPGYLPSSYNLSRTFSQPGLVALDFTSPSIPEILKIAQHRTAWDSNSLLDNFVAKQTDDYSTVHGEGLTIYLFGQNQAAWVNHGIWYSIEGASKLSREQILKIAYSL
ncbi:MAG TPA: hypothetical protein VI322_00685 [Candidatus Saccharimonadia bacterium]